MPDDPASATSERRADVSWARRKVFGWDLWRATMFAGSVVLLAQAVANAVMGGDLAGWVRTAAMIGGYILLAVGFALAMRARRKS